MSVVFFFFLFFPFRTKDFEGMCPGERVEEVSREFHFLILFILFFSFPVLFFSPFFWCERKE